MNRLLYYIVILNFPKYWGLPYKVLYSQAKLETGDFSSNIYRENNNLFGMKVPYIRPNFVQGENRGHAVFSSKYWSLFDLFLWLEYNNIQWNGNVLEFMKQVQISGFNPKTSYVKSWYEIYQNV